MLNFYPFVVYVFVTTFTPGPNNIMSMANGMQSGYKKTLRFLAGIFAGFFMVMLICGLLNFILLSLAPQMKFWLNMLGAVYMLYLAIHLLVSKSAEDRTRDRGMNSFRAGFAMQFLNVKVILYGITVYSAFIIQAYQNPLSVAAFAPILAGIGFIATSCWAIGGGLLQHVPAKTYRGFNLLMAGLLIYTAAASVIEYLPIFQ